MTTRRLAARVASPLALATLLVIGPVAAPVTARTTPTSTTASPAGVVVEALPTLKFDQVEYRASAGKVTIEVRSLGGVHSIRFDRRSLRRFRWDVSTSTTSVVHRVRLRPGRYVLYCQIPGHRAAGMEADLVVG